MCMIPLQSFKVQIKEFTKHINSIDKGIQFTVENTRADGSMPFLDTLVSLQPDATLCRPVYTKLTHPDQCLHRDSHHRISAKCSLVSTLYYRAKAASSTIHHLQKVLSRWKYPIWALNRMKLKNTAQTNPAEKNRGTYQQTSSTSNSNSQRCHILVPCTKGLCESIKNVCSIM